MTYARKLHLDSTAITLLVACCMCWGFQQALVKATVAEMPPAFQGGVRFAIALVALWAWCQWRKLPLWERDGSLGPGLLAGALFAAEFVFVYIGLQFTHASRLTVFLYSAPFWVAVLLPTFVPSERIRGLQWVGLACAFAGVLLALGDGFAHGAGTWVGDLLGLAAGAMWGLTTVTIRATSLGRVSPEKQLFYQMAVSCAAFPALSLVLGEPWHWDWSGFVIGSLLVQALLVAFVSYLAWMWMLAHYPATRMSVFVFLTPVFAVAFGVLWLKEPITPGLLGGLALVGGGIVMVNRKPAVG